MITHYVHYFNKQDAILVLQRARYIDECGLMIKEGLMSVRKVSNTESLVEVIAELTVKNDILTIYLAH